MGMINSKFGSSAKEAGKAFNNLAKASGKAWKSLGDFGSRLEDQSDYTKNDQTRPPAHNTKRQGECHYT